jgi:hypothetical protein
MTKECWNFGSVDRFGMVTLKSARYTADYVGKQIIADPRVWTGRGLFPPFQVMSKGLGRDWVDLHAEELKIVKGVSQRGVPLGLPRYYAKRLGIKLNAAERQMLDQAPSKTRHVWIGEQHEDISNLRAPRDQRAADASARARLYRKGKM